MYSSNYSWLLLHRHPRFVASYCQSYTVSFLSVPNNSLLLHYTSLFQGTTDFDKNLNEWNTAAVTTLAYTFAGCKSFNSPLDKWDVSQVTDMSSTFSGATSFTGESIGTWNVGSVESFERTFLGATSFVGSTAMAQQWDVSSANTMHAMVSPFFLECWSSGSLTDPCVSRLFFHHEKFLNASSFDLNINAWDVSNVKLINSLFENATSYSQRVCWTSGMHSSARCYQCFCNTNDAGFDLSADCPAYIHYSIQAYSKACKPTDDEQFGDGRFGRPEQNEYVSGLSGTGSFSSSGPEFLEQQEDATAGVQKEASMAYSFGAVSHFMILVPLVLTVLVYRH